MTTTAAMAGERKPRSRTATRLADAVSRWAFMAPAAIILAAMLAYPIFYTIEISFSRFDLMTFSAVEWVGWQNYAHVLDDYRFWSSMKVTLVYLVFALPLQIVLGFGIAFLINAEWRGRGLVRALFIIPMVVAPVVAGGIWRMILDPLWGIVNWLIGLAGFAPLDWFGDPTLAMAAIVIIDTWRWTPFVVLIATAALLALPRDIFEAAEIDGANWWSMLWSITLPLLVPIIAATFVVRWLGAVKMFDIALAATYGGPGGATDTVSSFIYRVYRDRSNVGYGTALAMFYLVLIIIFLTVLLRVTRRWTRSVND